MHNTSKWINQYLSACEYQRGLDAKTVKAYRIDLGQFAKGKWELTRDGILSYVSDLQSKYKARTIRRKIASLKAFCNYLEYIELISENPFMKLKLKVGTPQILPRTIPLSSIERILAAAYHRKEECKSRQQRASCLRDIAVLELLFATGIRVSELCSLSNQDVRLEEEEVKIYGKGAKERFVQITNPSVLQALGEYRKEVDPSEAFFINRLGNPLSDQSVRGIVKKYGKLGGVNQHITPHMFRHSFATFLLEEDVDIRYIQRLLGHSSIVTTQIYTHVAGRKQRDILSTKHPRNKLDV